VKRPVYFFRGKDKAKTVIIHINNFITLQRDMLISSTIYTTKFDQNLFRKFLDKTRTDG
jgi:hypothetical protein